MKTPIVAILTPLLLGPLLLSAQPAPTSPESIDQLAKTLKPLISSALPTTLYEKTENWGHQVMVPSGLKWRGLKPQVTKSPRDHGEWKKLIITAQELPRTLELKIYDLKN